MAAGWGSAENIELLIEEGADVHARDTTGMTTLMFAAHHGTDENSDGADGRGCGCSVVKYARFDSTDEFSRAWFAKAIEGVDGRQRRM